MVDLTKYGNGKVEEIEMIHTHGLTLTMLKKTPEKKFSLFSVKLYDKAKEYGLLDTLLRFEITLYKETLKNFEKEKLMLPCYLDKICWKALNKTYLENQVNKRKPLIILLRNYFKKKQKKK